MKLKTLKDLEEGKYDFKGLVRIDHLRQEAIKRIKLREKRVIELSKDKSISEDTATTWMSQNNAIVIELKDFFNITSEDLK